MPIYEFFSPDTNKIYSFFARSVSLASSIPRCPDNPSATMQRVLSPFAVTGRAKKESDAPADDQLDPKLERVMAEMEGEMASIDENNPDPRAIGRLMRKMAEATGHKVPGEMEQMLRRLEGGEDPEKLEEEFGDALGDLGEGILGADEQAESARTILKAHRAKPKRDPKLYEMRDYLR